MTITELKQYIYKEEKIPFILKEIGCHNIKYHEGKNYFSAAVKDGDNPNGVVIYNNEYLNYYSYSRNKGFDKKLDLIALVQDTNKESFVSTLKYLHRLMELDFRYTRKPEKTEKNILDMGAEILLKHKRHKKVDVEEIKYLEENRLDTYVPSLHIDWLREGVFFTTAKKFGLAFSYERSRIIIPHRHWLTGKLVGVNARTTIPDYDILGVKKYWLTPGYKKSFNIYGLYEHMDDIKKAGYVVCVESEKSVLKRDSLLDNTCVALSGHMVSDEQRRILLGLDVEIVIAFDKDVDINEIRFICNKFWHFRKTSYIYDKYGVMKDKESPCDLLDKVYQVLFKYRVVYDDKEDFKYQQWLKRK